MNKLLRSQIAALGRAISPSLLAGTADLFASTVPVPDESKVLRDLAYGPHARHRLDVFLPPELVADRPVLLFVHGGGFVTGDKGRPGSPFYNNVGAWAAANGCIGITMTYRLAPDSVWPAGSDDVSMATQWVHKHAQEWGGGAPKVILMGHSAGAAHVAGCLARWPTEANEGRPLAAILLSGLYDLCSLTHSPFENKYYGTDSSRFDEMSSLSGLVGGGWTCLYTVSELDPPSFQQQAARVVEASVAHAGAWPQMVYLEGHNHISGSFQLGGPRDTLGPQLMAFVQRVTGREEPSPTP